LEQLDFPGVIVLESLFRHNIRVQKRKAIPMSAPISPASSQGVISTQLDRIQNDRPTATEAPRPREVETPPPPPPPPADSGRGGNVDRSA
jgi:hypothetical protein